MFKLTNNQWTEQHVFETNERKDQNADGRCHMEYGNAKVWNTK